MKIKVLGPGCPNCEKVEKLVKEVLRELNQDAEVEKVTDFNDITKEGVMMTPGLSINDEVKFQGKIPSKDEVTQAIKAELG